MIKTIDEFYLQSQKYVDLFNVFAKKHELIGLTKADHICYKCGSPTSFESLRTIFENNSEYIYQSLISKRRISIIKLKQSISTLLGEIHFVELSDQKPDQSQSDGFDHIEVYGTSISYDELVTTLAKTEKVIKVQRPHHTTHDVKINEHFLFRCTQEPLITKIKHEEMI